MHRQRVRSPRTRWVRPREGSCQRSGHRPPSPDRAPRDGTRFRWLEAIRGARALGAGSSGRSTCRNSASDLGSLAGPLGYELRDASSLIVAELGVHRQAQNLPAQLLGPPQASVPHKHSIPIARLLMDRHRIEDRGGHAMLAKERAEPVSIQNPQGVLMKRVLDVPGAARCRYAGTREAGVVDPRDLPASRVLGFERGKLGPQNGGLQLVEPCVQTRLVADVSLAPSILADLACLLRQRRV